MARINLRISIIGILILSLNAGAEFNIAGFIDSAQTKAPKIDPAALDNKLQSVKAQSGSRAMFDYFLYSENSINSGQFWFRQKGIQRERRELRVLFNKHKYLIEGNGGNKSVYKKLGADYLCFAKIKTALGSSQITAQLVDLKTMKYSAIGKANVKLSELDQLTETSGKVVSQMLGAADSNIGGGGQTNSLAREGKTYKTVKMPDGKIWMAENMNDAAGKSACYQNSEANCQRCGRLYDWATATMICPSGWHLPSDAEWTALANAAGGSTAGTVLKSKSGWSNDGNGMDKHGFSALPCGNRNTDGSFNNYGSNANFWSATENGSGNAWNRNLNAGNANVNRNNNDKANLFSVRCVRD